MATAVRLLFLLAFGQLRLGASLRLDDSPPKPHSHAVQSSKPRPHHAAKSAKPHHAVPTWPRLHHAAQSAKSVTAHPVSSPFKNVLLVVHCRLKIHGLDYASICEERRPLFRNYKKYFADVLYITPDVCPRYPGDPQSCIAKIMLGPGADRDGIFYIHFDSLIRPRQLAPTFDVNSMYTFDRPKWCEIDRETLGEEHCVCRFWNTRRANDFQNAIDILRDSDERAFRHLDPWQFWTANDDIFYVPNKVYDLYGKMAPAFSKVHHEIAGPTMRVMLQKLTKVPVKSLGCTGGCCKKLTMELALQVNFTCGHSFELQKSEIRNAFPKAISTFTDEDEDENVDYMPLDTWKKMLEQALE